MTKKTSRINMRTSPYYEDLLDLMIKKENSDKSKVIHAAIEYYAMHVLGQEEVMNLRLYKYFEG